MKPPVMKALEEWKDASDALQERAVNVLRLALPGLDHSKTPPYCCPVTLTIDRPGDLGHGRICIDDDRRATVEITNLPNAVIAEGIDAVFGIGWFDSTDAALEDCEPGKYHYDDEMSGSEYTIGLGEDPADGSLNIDYVPIPFAAEVLDAISTARDRQADEHPDTARDGSSA
ncbi:hypothetical protein HFP70_35355 [Streptomyces sp. ARC14]|uniref:hypothetical protein n=1 Tax=Streptomyces sp. ARC14 TaxID=2724152 RepID=UPI003857D6F1